VAGTPRSRTALAAALAFLAAAIGVATLWVALDTRSPDGLEAVVVPPLVLGVALAAGWACVLGVGLLGHWSWARRGALLTFLVVGALSGSALADTIGRVVDGDTTPLRHLLAPASLFAVATSIVLLLAFAREPDRS
jgi:DMSO reductase anchor subunit